MPIYDMEFRDGIFFAREVGRIDQADAELWAHYANRFAAASISPIVALVDAREVTSITPEARRIFVKASYIPNLKCGAVAARDVVSQQSSRIVGWMAERDHTHVFQTLEEARAFAESQVETAHTG